MEEKKAKSAGLTEKERKARIEALYAELKELSATPRDDWHVANDALFRIEFYKYGDKVSIESEHTLGAGPPRADYLIISELESIEFDKEIFKLFRRHNIVEYKNPYDSLDIRTVRKLVGYGNMYAGNAERKGDIEEGQVTLSVFRATRPVGLFGELKERADVTVENVYTGVYYIKGITDMPMQVVVTSELEGEKYASFRALSNKASEEDIRKVISDSSINADSFVKERYRVFLNFISGRNNETVQEIRRKEKMGSALMEIMKDEIDKVVDEAVEEAVEKKDREIKETVEKKNREIKEAVEKKNREIKEAVDKNDRENKKASIKSVMNNLGLSLDRAMEVLDIPMDKREMYANFVNT